MNFRVNDKVRVSSLAYTEPSCLGAGRKKQKYFRFPREGIVTEFYPAGTCAFGGHCEEAEVEVKFKKKTFWLSAGDLELIEKAPVPLDFNRSSIGKKVRLLDPSSNTSRVGGCETIDESLLDANEVFDIVSDDPSDNSFEVGGLSDTCWIFANELILADSPEASETEEEGPEPCEESTDKVNFMITNDAVTLSINGVSETVTPGSPNFVEVRQAVIDEEFAVAHTLMNVSIGIKLQDISGRTLKVIVKSKDFVAVPTYNDNKDPVCEYKVIEAVTDKTSTYLDSW
jgi:hypothetical protein